MSITNVKGKKAWLLDSGVKSKWKKKCKTPATIAKVSPQRNDCQKIYEKQQFSFLQKEEEINNKIHGLCQEKGLWAKRYAILHYNLHTSFTYISSKSITTQQIYEVDIIFLSLCRLGNWNSDFKCFYRERKLSILWFKYFLYFFYHITSACCPLQINHILSKTLRFFLYSEYKLQFITISFFILCSCPTCISRL